ncbi:MAG: phenylalanine--tRNA ligase subunit beta [Synechococcales bacterium]|nr:phenylalanine--tRNA ligase subunit beta [Synechococcales bacterium]
MRISLEWLQELVNLTMTPEELAEMLTMAGFEVEDIEDRRTWADGVVVGEVLDCQPHPNADKLRVCTVNIGTDTPSTIVCGAANVRADICVPVATVGTYLPKIDLKISARKLRGVPSAGMICSLAELGLAKDSEGIYIFPQDSLKPGEDARPYLGLDDVVLDLTSTANRADALSIIGIAREVAALTGSSLKLPKIPDISEKNNLKNLSIQVDAKACPVYVGTVIEQVQLAPSPKWLQQRLQAAGTRPINNVVDITNYILLEWGQPLHAFDRDRLLSVTQQSDMAIGVRFAQPGETLTTLDSQSRSLQEQTLLITDHDVPVALAGVMGGEETEVHDGTQAIFLEAAIFDPVAIRRSARSQSLRTEASSRYERGVNQAELELACRRAISLIQDLAGGTVVGQAIADHRASQTGFSRTIELRLERVNQVLGPVLLDGKAAEPSLGSLSAQDVERTLTALGCQLAPVKTKRAKEVVWSVTVPPYRYRDLEREIDLIEEVARIYGYNRFADTLPAKTEPGRLSNQYALVRQIRESLQAVGLTELMHYSLVKPGDERQIVLANPLFAEYSALRTDLLPALIDAFQYNLEQGNGPLWGFEVGRIFWRSEADAFQETDIVAGIFGGDPRTGKWRDGGRDRPITWFEAKGVLENVFQRLGLTVEYRAMADIPRLHPGRTASLWLENTHLGTFGQIHPQLRQARELPDEVYLFDLNLDILMQYLDRPERITPIFQPYSSYPASDRDIAFYASDALAVGELALAMQQAGQPLLASVELFDEYRGESVPEGQRSLAFRLVYRAGDRTLTDEDVEPLHQQVRDALVTQFGVTPRS